MRVAVVGAGLGGLCLAHGLRGLGVDVTVLEREPAVGAHRQGYRLNLNATGAAGLAACLPAPLLAAHRAAAHHQTAPTVTIRTADGEVVVSHRLDEEHAVAVDRSTLRHILLAGLDETVHFGRAVDGVTPDGRVLLADGTTVTADLVVGADGPGSVVRRSLAPGNVPSPFGLNGIYGRTPLDAPLRLGPVGIEALRSRFTGLADGRGNPLALGAWCPSGDVAAAGVDLTDLHPYLMWALLTPDPVGGTPAELHRQALDMVDGWVADAREVVGAADVADTFALTIRTDTTVPVWTPGPVTLLGDAAHTMTPAGGEGANAALGDAALLTAAIARHVRGEIGLLDAVAAYDRELRRTGDAALARSAAYGTRPSREDQPA